MKNVFFVLFLFISLKLFSQHPIGNDSFQLQTAVSHDALFKSKGAIGSDSGFVNSVYGDTSMANLGKLKNYPGAQIRVGDSIWVRNSTATQWLNQSREGSGGTGVNQRWQETMDVTSGSLLDHDNDIDGGGFDFFWNNMRHYINKTAEIGSTDGRLNIGVSASGGSDKALRVKSARNDAYYEIADNDQPGNGGADAINVTSVNKDGNTVYSLTGRWLQMFDYASPITIANGNINVSTDIGGLTGIDISPNTIQTNSGDLVFKYKDGFDPTAEILRFKTTGQIQGTSFYPNSDATQFLTADASGNFILAPVINGSGIDTIYSFTTDSIVVRKKLRVPLSDTTNANKKKGNIIYDTLINEFYGYNNVAWDCMSCGSINNANVGSGFRWLKPGTQEIKTVFNSYGLNWDSTTNTNGLTPTIDTFAISTRAWRQKLADSLGALIASGGGGLAHTYAPYVISGDTIYKRYNVRSYGAIPNDGIDDTQPIQNAINACELAGGGEVDFPLGIYLISGAIKTSDGRGFNPNSQIYIPSRNATDSLRTHIILKGEVAPNFTPGGGLAGSTNVLITKGVILKSSLTTGATGAAVIGTGGTFNYNYLSVENIAIQVKNNPSGTGPVIGGISYKNGSSLMTKNVAVYIDTAGVNSTLPSNDVVGIETPDVGSEGFNNLQNTLVVGFRSGYKIGEHAVMNNVHAWCCYYGFNFKQGTHTFEANRIATSWCATDIYVIGSSNFINLQLDNERIVDGHWFDYVATIKDSANLGHGAIYYRIVPNNSFFIKSGGATINTYAHDSKLADLTVSNSFAVAPTFSTMTIGSILFAGTSGVVSQDNTKLFWDNTNKRLGLGTITPSDNFTLYTGSADATLKLQTANTGTAGTDGFNFGIENSSKDVYVNQRENANVFFYVNGAEAYRITSAQNTAFNNNLVVGGTAIPTSSAKNIVLYNGTAATGNATNGIILQSVAGELQVRDASGNVTTLSPHYFNKIPNGRSDKMAWAYYSERDSNYINVDMYKAVKTIETLTGEVEELKKEIAELKGIIYKKKQPIKLIYTGKVK